MPRMTRTLPGENHYSLDGSRIEKCADGWHGEAVDRLAAFENMHEALQQRLREIPSELDALKVQGKEKTVTFRELAAQKMLYRQWLDMAQEYGVTE